MMRTPGAGHRADEVWRLLGAHEKCNFDADGNPTGSQGSVASLANLSGRRGNDRVSRFSGIVTDKNPNRAKPYRAQVSVRVPDCREHGRACPFEGVRAKCECWPLHGKRSKAFSTQEEAAGAWNALVRKWRLDKMRVDPLVLNAL